MQSIGEQTAEPRKTGSDSEIINPIDVAIQPLLDLGQTTKIPANQPIFHRGDLCESYFLVISGSVKVMLIAASGREIVLYHVGAGESCVLTTSCLMAGDHYPAEGITETAVTALVFDKATFHRSLHESEAFRKLVFADLGKRFSGVISRIEQVSFSGVDARLAEALLCQPQFPQVFATHQMLATDIGSAREVVSRQLKLFETKGWVKLGRGHINVLQPEALRQVLNNRS